MNERKIPGGIAVAFQTKRKMFMTHEILQLRAKNKAGTLTSDEVELVLNALEMSTEELWQMQRAMACMQTIHADLRNALNGSLNIERMLEELANDAYVGHAEIPDLTPDDLRDHYKKKMKEDE